MKRTRGLSSRWLALVAGLSAVLMALPAVSLAQDGGTSTGAPLNPPGTDTLDRLNNTVIPVRDRIDLARRLLGVTDIPAPPTTAPPEYQIGDEKTFWAHNQDNDTEFQVTARLVYKTDHVYMFVENGYDLDPAAVKRSADTFEQTIRPLVHAVFGTEWFPGIDGDPHLVILHAAGLGNSVAAYYASSSQYPVEAVSNSNEHEMFFVNLDALFYDVGGAGYESVLAHEFQHMVHWHMDLNEEGWLNEGLSELAAMLTGYGMSDFTPFFLTQPTLQLTTWGEDPGENLRHYGMSFLFAAYLYQRYGETAVTALVADPENGLAGVEKMLATVGAVDPSTGQPVTAVDLFADWLVTVLLQNPAVGDGRYAYTLPEMISLVPANISAQLAVTLAPVEAQVPQWGPVYLKLTGSGDPRTFRFRFEGSPTVPLVPAVPYSGQQVWWSNRADESDTRLTRAFDLTGVDRATLSYALWYQIEELWDYGYVMVSTDDGATWTVLETDRTTADNPHRAAYGPGYTGQSGGWVQETVDLTPFAGQDILLRFEMITDQMVNLPGMLIDDIRIPEIGYFDDMENGDGGWLAEGWLRTDALLPQRFLVQVVQPDSLAQPVTRLLSVGDTPQGEWTITVGGPAGDAVLVIAGLAPVTTEPATYRYTLVPVE